MKAIGNKPIMNIGILPTIPSYGGGSHQWTINILHALKDYTERYHNTKVHVFYYPHYIEGDRLRSVFTNFHFYKIEKLRYLMLSALRRLANTAPVLIPVIRSFFPLNSILEKEHIDLMLFPTTVLDASFCNKKHIFFLADISHVFYPNFPEVSANGELKRRHVLFKYGLRYANQIVVESKQLLNDIVKYYHADMNKIDVLYQTFSQTLKVANTEDVECLNFESKLPSKYIFYPAQLWEHKNHKNLLFAMQLVNQKIPDLYLILTGSRKKGDEKIFSLIEELKLQGNVKYLGYVSDMHIPVLYKNAQMLVLPTYFGPTNIPTLEAFYYGCPAVISNLPGVIEQTGEASLLFNPDSPQDIAEKILLVLTNGKLRNEMIKLGYERIKILSYDNYRNNLFNILDKNLKVVHL